MKRDEVERRVKEDTEEYSDKFSSHARHICSQVSTKFWLRERRLNILYTAKYCKLLKTGCNNVVKDIVARGAG